MDIVKADILLQESSRVRVIVTCEKEEHAKYSIESPINIAFKEFSEGEDAILSTVIEERLDVRASEIMGAQVSFQVVLW